MRQLTRTLLLGLFMPVLGCSGGETEPLDGGRPETTAEAGQPATLPLRVTAGTTGELSPTCRVGLVAVTSTGARLGWWPTGAREKVHQSVQAPVPVQGLFPACGQLHRLVSIASGQVVIDRAATPLPTGLALGADSVAVPLLGDTILAPDLTAPGPTVTVKLSVRALTGAPPALAAAVDLRETEYRMAGDPPSKTTDRMEELRAGGRITAGAWSYPVLNIVGGEHPGIAGWVEIDPRAQPRP